MDEMKQAKKLFKKLVNDQNSVFYSAEKINRTLLSGARKPAYKKDKVFYKICISLEDQENIYDDDNDKEKTRIPFYTPFIEQKKDINRSSALYSINAPM